MAEKQSKDSRPLDQLAGKNWDIRRRKIANQEADAQSRKAAIKEISKASREGGKDSRTGMIESGILARPTGGVVSGLVDTGTKKRRGSGSW